LDHEHAVAQGSCQPSRRRILCLEPSLRLAAVNGPLTGRQ
jgi:hypothetical protein